MRYLLINITACILFSSCVSKEFDNSMSSYFVTENIIVKDSLQLNDTIYAFWIEYDLSINGIFGNSGGFISVAKDRTNINDKNWVLNSDWIIGIETPTIDTLMIVLNDDDLHLFTPKINNFEIVTKIVKRK